MLCSKASPASKRQYGTTTVTLWPDMNLAALGFRFRVFVFVLLYLLGFWAPWAWQSGSRGSLWLAASTWAARTGWLGLADATLAVTLAALGCLVLGAILRVW